MIPYDKSKFNVNDPLQQVHVTNIPTIHLNLSDYDKKQSDLRDYLSWELKPRLHHSQPKQEI